jgi:hypothetical protein
VYCHVSPYSHRKKANLQEKKKRTQQQQLTLNTSSLSPNDIHSFSLMAKQNIPGTNSSKHVYMTAQANVFLLLENYLPQRNPSI